MDTTEGRPAIIEVIPSQSGISAAAYLRIQSGQVARFIGFRCAPEFEDELGKRLLSRFEELPTSVDSIHYLHNESEPQDQPQYASLMKQLGFAPACELHQLWTHIKANRVPPDTNDKVGWKHASQVSLASFCDAVRATFVNTLDSPALHSSTIQTNPQLLDALFDRSRTPDWLEDRLPASFAWYLLTYQTEVAGCVLLSEPQGGLLNINYLGLAPQFRGLGLGIQLIEKAKQQARLTGMKFISVAVDSANYPAINLYQTQEFHLHHTYQLYMRAR